MLYDNRWDHNADWRKRQIPRKFNSFRRYFGFKEKFNPSLNGFVAWLDAQNPYEKYCYPDNRNCAVMQYHRAIGFRHSFSFSEGLDHLARQATPRTFGGLSVHIKLLYPDTANEFVSLPGDR